MTTKTTTSLADLFEAKLLRNNEALEIRMRGRTLPGRVVKPGEIIPEGSDKAFASPSSAAAHAMGIQAVNGWLVWRVVRLDKPLKALRSEYESGSAEPSPSPAPAPAATAKKATAKKAAGSKRAPKRPTATVERAEALKAEHAANKAWKAAGSKEEDRPATPLLDEAHAREAAEAEAKAAAKAEAVS